MAPFYIHQMNRVNSRNGSAMINIVVIIIIIIIIMQTMQIRSLTRIHRSLAEWPSSASRTTGVHSQVFPPP